MDLYNLESLLQECNNPLTANDRRREIERNLFAFDETENSWNFYLHILQSQSSSELACHLAMSMLEGKVTKKWTLLTDSVRLAIRSGICGLVREILLSSSPLLRQSFFVKKLLRLCADVARHDWPHDYPDFMDSVFQLCTSGDLRQASIGFVFLRTVSEEFTDEKALFTTQRRTQLRILFEQLLPRIGELLCLALQSWISACTDEQQSSDGKRDQAGDVAIEALNCLAHLLTWAPLHLVVNELNDPPRLFLVELLFHVFANGFTATNAPTDLKRHNCAQLVLSCIAELFGRQRCLPKDATIVLQVASSFFQVVAQLVIPHLETARNSQDSSLTDIQTSPQLSLLEGVTNCFSTFFSMCFTPLILSNPTNREGVVLSEMLVLLARYTLTQPESDALCGCLDIWVTVMEALLANGQNSLSSIETGVLEFCQRLLVRAMFTTNQRELDELDDGDSAASSGSNIFGKTNKTIAEEEFDNSNCDFDGIFGDQAERDYQLADGDGSDLPKAERFFVAVSSVIRQIAIAYPKMVICDLLLSATQQRATFFVDLTRNLVPERILNSNVRAVDAARIHCVSRDLATLVSLVAGVADLLTHDHATGFSVFSSLTILTHHSCHLVALATPASGTSPLREDLVRLHSRLFASLRAAFVHVARPIMLGSLTTPKQTPDEMAQQLAQSIIGAIEAAVQLITTSSASEVLQASVPFLYACLTSRIPAICNCQSFLRLYPWLAASPESGQILNLLSPSLRIQLCSGLIASLFLPHSELRDNMQDWAGRSKTLAEFFAQLIAPYFNLSYMNNANDRTAPTRIKWLKNSLRLVTAVCRLVATESPQSRQLVVNCIVMGSVEHVSNVVSASTTPLLETCLALLPLWQRSADVEGMLALMAFFSAVVNLQAQMESSEMDRLIQTVMDSFPPSVVCANLLNPSSGISRQSEIQNHQLLAAFFSILRHVFSHGDFASVAVQRRNKPFLSAAIRFCLEDLRPAIATNQATVSSVLPSFLSLLETIVADNWHFFSRKFGSSSGLGNLVDDVDRLEEAHFPYLVSIVETLFGALLLTEIEVVRRAVAALNRLDTRCRLFSRQFFASSVNVINAVSTTILSALLAGAHDLLRDDILVLLHTILEKAQLITSNNDRQNGLNFFFRSILPTYVASQLPSGSAVANELVSSLLGASGLPTDQPTFTSQMSRFIADLRYHIAVVSSSSPSSLSIPSSGWLLSAVRPGQVHHQHLAGGATAVSGNVTVAST